MLQGYVEAQVAIALDEPPGNGRGVVRGVVENLDLQLRTWVAQAHHRLNQPLEDVALVIDWQLYGHARVPQCARLPGLLHGSVMLEYLTPNTVVQEEQDVAIHAIEEETAGGQAMQQQEAVQQYV